MLGPLLSLMAALAQSPEAPGAVLGELRLEGVSAYTRDEVLRILRLVPGGALPRPAPDLAAALERRYRSDGYMAATVQGAYDPDEQRLSLTADEGELAELAIEGLSGAAADRARRELGLEPGAPLLERDVLGGLFRLEVRSDGALVRGEPPYTVESAGKGARLTVRLHPRKMAAGVRLGGPSGTGLYQRADGFVPWVGAAWTVHNLGSYRHIRVYGRVGFGAASERAGFVLGVSRPIGAGVGAGYEFHDFTDTDDVFRASGAEETLGALLGRAGFRDYHRRRGHEGYVFARWSEAAQVGLSVRSDDHRSLPVEADWSVLGGPPVRPNPAAAEGHMRSLVVTARAAPGGVLFGDDDAERESRLARDLYGGPQDNLARLRADASFEWASSRALGGDFSFRRLLLQVRGRRELGPGSLGARVVLGVTGGEPPPQRRLALGGLGTLRGHHYKQFVGDHAVFATLEWGRAPAFPRPGVALFYDGGATWTRGGGASGWQDDLGVGVTWGLGVRAGLRVDCALPLPRAPGRDRVRFTARLHGAF